MKEFLGIKIKIISTNAEILKFYFFIFKEKNFQFFKKYTRQFYFSKWDTKI